MADSSGRWGCLLVLLGGLRGEVGGGGIAGGCLGCLGGALRLHLHVPFPCRSLVQGSTRG